MLVVDTVAALRRRLAQESNVSLVPTMGNLHGGHISLVQIAKQHTGCVVASIFVNRLQFEPGGDFERYPRTLEKDCSMLDAAGVDIVFAPAEREMYPEPQQVTVQPSAVASMLEGEHRPGHFIGMATVVLKLFNIVQPQAAIFGNKDYQQQLVIRDLVRQLNLPIDVIAGPTQRESDGLARSSRNAYLSDEQRIEAARLYEQLQAVKNAIEAGGRNFAGLEKAAVADLAKRGWKVDYIAVREQRNLTHPGPAAKELAALAAAWLGKTRLIDNVEIDIG